MLNSTRNSVKKMKPCATRSKSGKKWRNCTLDSYFKWRRSTIGRRLVMRKSFRRCLSKKIWLRKTLATQLDSSKLSRRNYLTIWQQTMIINFNKPRRKLPCCEKKSDENRRVSLKSAEMRKRMLGIRSISWQTRIKMYLQKVSSADLKIKLSWLSKCENWLLRTWREIIKQRIYRRKRISLIQKWFSNKRSSRIFMLVSSNTKPELTQSLRKIFRSSSCIRRSKSLRNLSSFLITRLKSWRGTFARKKFRFRNWTSRRRRWDQNRSTLIVSIKTWSLLSMISGCDKKVSPKVPAKWKAKYCVRRIQWRNLETTYNRCFSSQVWLTRSSKKESFVYIARGFLMRELMTQVRRMYIRSTILSVHKLKITSRLSRRSSWKKHGSTHRKTIVFWKKTFNWLRS